MKNTKNINNQNKQKMTKPTSFAHACKLNGHTTALPIVKHLPKDKRKYIVAQYKMAVIVEAINKKRRPNYNDSSEYKYELRFWIVANSKKPSGFGFSVTAYVGWNTATIAGSRLVFFTKEDALYVAKKFKSIWKDIILYT